MRKCTLVLILIFACVTIVNAQEVTKVGTTAANFLKLEVGARAIGMAGAFVPVSNDGSSLYWNPAGIAQIERYALTYHNVDLYAGIRHQFVGVILPVGSNNTFGVSFNYVDIGDIEETTIEEPDGTGRFFSSNDLAVGLTYSRRLTDRLSFGITGHYIHERIWTETSNGFAFDFGSLFQPGLAGLRIGMTITNLGPEMHISNGPNITFEKRQDTDFPGNRRIPSQFVTQKFELPMTFRLGVQMSLIGGTDALIANTNNSVTLVAQFDDAFDNALRATYAMEYWWNETIALRGGLRQNYDLAQFTFGGGLQVPVKELMFRFDYAIADYGDLGNVNIISVELLF